MIERDWFGCYSGGWTGIIHPSAFSHPAKFSRGLIRRIYDHLFEQGYLHEGDTVVDPFAGVALGGLHAMQHGCHWIGVELEQRFVDLGQQNIDLWLATYAPHFPKWGTAVILQGDSRNLGEVVGQVAGASVGSPPFADSLNSGDRKAHIDWSKTFDGKDHRGKGTGSQGSRSESYTKEHDPRNLGNLRATDAAHRAAVQAAVGSPPYVESIASRSENTTEGDREHRMRIGRNPDSAGSLPMREYGRTDGQLGAMHEGDLQAAISSAPYTASLASDDPDKRGGLYRDPKRRNDKTLTAEYGDSAGQLGAMREGDHGAEVRGCVSSAPWEASGSEYGCDGDANFAAEWQRRHGNRIKGGPMWHDCKSYGASDGQLGNSTGPTFWSAARLILEQTYQLLAPGAYSVWVCKSFVRSGERVDFPNQWRELGEACGFETVEWIRAWLTEDRGNARALFDFQAGDRTVERGETVYSDGKRSKEIKDAELKRCSFFRRLAESKGSPRIDYEVVLVQRKKERDA